MVRRTREHKKSKLACDLSVKVAFAVIVCVLSIYLMSTRNEKEEIVETPSASSQSEKVQKQDTSVNKRQLRLWSVSVRQWNPNGSLRTMYRVFEKLGYRFVNASNGDDWDFLWSIEYPYKSTIRRRTELFKPMEHYKPRKEQRINHIPGIQFITNKAFLGSYTKSKYLLPTFLFPDDGDSFSEFIGSHPDAKFVEKNYNNRGVRVVSIEEFDRENVEKIYQVFMDKPFLLDGHAFDFGVYVLITSVDPLRIYRYDHEIFLRFCPEKYHPFDAQNRQKYVVDDGHMSVYELPLFGEIYANYGFTFKLIFENLIRSAGFNVDVFWSRVDDAISSIILENEGRMIERILKEKLNTTVNFFELVRFDMILDEKLNPFVMEVNMSPNLTPAAERFEENVLIYEPLVYNTLKLISAASYDEFMSRFNDEIISSNFKNLATNFATCTQNNCNRNCDSPLCKTCLPCVEPSFAFYLHEAYREHVRMGNFKRVFPSNPHFNNPDLFSNLTDNNKLMLKWYEAKCENNKNWC